MFVSDRRWLQLGWPARGPWCGQNRPTDLVEVAQRLVQVGVHAGRRFVGDLDRRLEDALRNDVRLGSRRRLGADEHTEAVVALDRRLLQLLLQRVEPTRHQVHVLRSTDTHAYTVNTQQPASRSFMYGLQDRATV